MQAEATLKPWRFDHCFVPLVIFLGLVASLVEAVRSPDPLMVVQAWTFGVCMAVIGVWYTWMYAERSPADEKQLYADAVVKAGVGASMFWGIAGMLVGVVIALQLSFPHWFYFPDQPWTNFGRLRPLHTSAVIFAFGGNVLIATSFYVVQRTSRARLFGGSLSWLKRSGCAAAGSGARGTSGPGQPPSAGARHRRCRWNGTGSVRRA
jgi:cytochrome c oxidase cbb3-type subunit 1